MERVWRMFETPENNNFVYHSLLIKKGLSECFASYFVKNYSFWYRQIQPLGVNPAHFKHKRSPMVIFPWKQKIVGQSIQRCSAKKSGQPLDKNSWSARAATVSNLQQKIKTKVWSCSRKLSTRAEEGVYWFARPPLQTCSALSQVYSNKKSEKSINNLSRK